ncbi:hypothetical protein BCAR13_730040 [Paraburkholderia caribensis]|nr:hypothetical protein BCAR13_730040 [Paraburkholderia caribensis]
MPGSGAGETALNALHFTVIATRAASTALYRETDRGSPSMTTVYRFCYRGHVTDGCARRRFPGHQLCRQG